MALTSITVGTGMVGAGTASAGGVGDFLSPAFGTSCANQNTATRADGATRHGTGTASGNLAGLPIGSPLNQCGGADVLPKKTKLTDFVPLITCMTCFD
ncbi:MULTISPECIES: chaplin family protein [unclassified Streptomyces]|uniref:chaplin family protein n=1 Tax=unclassified Streptomyces TaxID=2593676 RepID=UPI0033D72FC0